VFERSPFSPRYRTAVAVRPVQPADAQSVAALYVQSWRDTYLGIIPPDHLYSMSVERQSQQFHRDLVEGQVFGFVAERRGRLVGFVTGGPERSGDSVYAGEIYAQNPFRHFYEKRNGIFLRSQRTPFAGVLLELTAYGWINAGLLRM